MSFDPKFECDKCGLCCRCLKDNPNVKDTPLERFDRGDGVCIHLTPDNLCDIYEHRPLVCNVDKQYDKFWKDKMTREQFHAMQKNGCDYIRKMAAFRNKEGFGL